MVLSAALALALCLAPAPAAGRYRAERSPALAFDPDAFEWRLTPGIVSFNLLAAGGPYFGTEHGFGVRLAPFLIFQGYLSAAFLLQDRHVFQGGGVRWILEGVTGGGGLRAQLGLGIGYHFLGDPCRESDCRRCDLDPWWGLLRFTPRVLFGGPVGDGWLYFVLGVQLTGIPDAAVGPEVGFDIMF